MSDTSLPVWSCAWTQESLAKTSWTVGEKRDLVCLGDGRITTGKNYHIEFEDPKNQYTLMILENKKLGENEATFVVTSYKAGEFKDVNFAVKDESSQGFSVKGFNWNIETVLKQGAQPVAPYGPFKLGMPWWYWLYFIVPIVIMGWLIFVFTRKNMQRKKLLLEMVKYQTPIAPHSQFHKDIRITLKKHYDLDKKQVGIDQKVFEDFLSELEQAFLLYILREYKIPTLAWTASAIVVDLKRKNKAVYEQCGKDIKKIIKEFKRSKKAIEKTNFQDCEQMLMLTRKCVDNMYALRKAEK